jgi:hypothetical protein
MLYSGVAISTREVITDSDDVYYQCWVIDIDSISTATVDVIP